MSNWRDLGDDLGQWLSTAAHRTEELARLGVSRYDHYGIRRGIDRELQELGRIVHGLLREGRAPELAGEAEVQAAVQRIRRLEDEERRKRQEIEDLRGRSAEQSEG
jgi:hypothetical protein